MPLAAKGKERVEKSRATKTKKSGKKDVVHEKEKRDPVILDDVPEDPVCNVGVSLARTVNLGDYESVRVEVSLHAPCLASEVDDSADEQVGWCSERLEKVLGELGVELGE